MADVLDKITDTRNSARPNSARVTSGRSVGVTTLSCDDLSGWPTASKVHFAYYQIDTNSDVVAGTQKDCYGIVVSNTITAIVHVDGTDTGNSINDVVEMLPTAAWGQDLAEGLSVVHERTGLMKSGVTYPLPVIASFANATHTHTNAAGGGTLGAAAVPALDYSVQTLSNPYKFSAYRIAAKTIVTNGVVQCDTEVYDTNNNFDTSTGRYTAPVSGYYQLNAQVLMNVNGNTNTAFGGGILLNNTHEVCHNTHVNMYNGGYQLCNASSTLLKMTAGDYVELYVDAAAGGGGTSLVIGSQYNCFINGFLVSRT